MKALVISPQPFFSPRGTPFSVYYRALVASKLGVKIDLLTYGEGQDVDIANLRIIRIPRFKFLGDVKVGPSYLKGFLDIFLVIWAFGLLLRNKYDFVHAHEEAVFFCRFFKPVFQFKLLYDMHSSLPQQLKNFKFTNAPFLINLFKKLEISSLHASDAVITVYPYLFKYVNTIIRDKGKNYLIENSLLDVVQAFERSPRSNPEHLSNEDVPEKPIKLPVGKHFVVYAGTLEVYQGIDLLISAFKRVVDGFPDTFLLVVGGQKHQVAYYSEMAFKYGIHQNILFTGRISHQLIKYYLAVASVLVSPRSHGINTPLKTYEQMASGIPLVATNISAHTQVLNDDIAFLVDPDPQKIAQGIIKALSSKEASLRISKNAGKYYAENYSRLVYEAKVRSVLELLSS